MSCECLPLGSLVEIKTGAPMSRAKKIADADDPIRTKVLVPAAMTGSRIDNAQLVGEVVSNVKDDLFTRERDVIVKASTPYDCVYIDKNHEGLLVTSFGFILRPIAESPVDMRYLALFLGLERTNLELQAMSKGMTIKLLKKRDIGDLMVPVPTLAEQTRLGALSESIQRCKELCRAISNRSDLLLQSEFARIAQSVC
ncbi:hypothetical protein [Enorma phocaeensis]|uniref:hypothetical protein n=1 Tax=Enorma phocaeensis TaxID=1871019 RepID=UPI00320A966B